MKMMSHETIVRNYFRAISQRDYQAIMKYFAPDASIEHPLYGKKTAADFFAEHLTDAKSDKITIKNILHDSQQPQVVAAYFIDEWATKDNTVFKHPMILIFNFTNDNTIRKLTVIFDTHPIRARFDKFK